MKTAPIHRLFTFVLATCALLVYNTISALSQDAKKLDVDIDINKGGDGLSNANAFFAQPWVWIVGGAVFILILVALLRGRGGRSNAS